MRVWAVTYKSHEVRYENNPFLGEKLFIANQLAGKGKTGYRSEIRGVIPSGDGAGDAIVAITEAGLLTVHCRITAQVPAAALQRTRAKSMKPRSTSVCRSSTRVR